jgi:hypothetical protein
MTLRQTAHAMIDSISDDNDVRFLIEIMGRLRLAAFGCQKGGMTGNGAAAFLDTNALVPRGISSL